MMARPFTDMGQCVDDEQMWASLNQMYSIALFRTSAFGIRQVHLDYCQDQPSPSLHITRNKGISKLHPSFRYPQAMRTPPIS